MKENHRCFEFMQKYFEKTKIIFFTDKLKDFDLEHIYTRDKKTAIIYRKAEELKKIKELDEQNSLFEPLNIANLYSSEESQNAIKNEEDVTQSKIALPLEEHSESK